MSPQSSPERIRIADAGGILNRVPEDEPLDADWEYELEEEGFYMGSYPRLVALYTLAPLTALLTLAALAALPYIFYRRPTPLPPSYPYTTLLPYPLPELLAPAALYALTHLLRDPLYAVSAFVVPQPLAATLLSTSLYTGLSIAARFAALALLLVRPHAVSERATWHDPAFARVWWAGLGWAAVEGAISVAQGYAGLALYRDVLVSQRAPTPPEPAGSPDSEHTPLLPARDCDLDSALDHDLEQLLALRTRDELADALGTPLVRVPAFIPCLQRFNALLLSLGLFLLLGAALFASAVALVAAAAAAHLLLAVLHAPGVLPRVGLHSAAFVGAVVSLGVFFAGLGVWGGVS
ncbi:hypothetical protein GGX14DRAFT_651337 [Mycena pura]|uniref:Uncharacterized protein n=1 Tax=Mycena pura TaxID=153505 RepID=A0AAD6YNX6_9AGAR|nr:hypothetical protein GGX14DRAFT_651337 [Mycena pura]